jgi:hypothetical protein
MLTKLKTTWVVCASLVLVAEIAETWQALAQESSALGQLARWSLNLIS